MHAKSAAYPNILTLVLLSFVLAFSYAETLHAESVLQVLPTRVVMEGNTRSVTVTLVNRGDEDGTYRMFFRNLRMDANGVMTEVKAGEQLEAELFADNMLRFSPRRITVPARSKQTIRVVARKPSDLGEGEYRSHLVFRKLKTQNSVLNQNAGENQVSFALRAVVEVTIPIIVRHGEQSASMNIADASMGQSDEGTKTMDFTLTRQGSRSIYGDVNLWEITPQGEKRNIGRARGLAVYAPNHQRSFSIELDETKEVASPNSKLLLEYKEDPNFGGNLQANIEL
ncbi:MAG: molecular chaperone [Pseudomonadales bacterium]